MKTKILTLSLVSFLSMSFAFSQDRTTVTAPSSDISDNLDLRAVASIFGDSENLNDFERRLNDPNAPISNLDLNQDNKVDYLRVIESVEGNTHLIIVQSVLGRDTFQDVATIEVERDRHNVVQVQVVGDVYMYGENYIYEPVYVHTPVIYTNFWVGNYHPYYSSWYWGYYPTYYYAWNPYPVYHYQSHINVCINFNYQYNYVNYRRSTVAYNMYRGRRSNGYEMQHPNRSFSNRNTGYTNRYELDRTRTTGTSGTQNGIRGTGNTRGTISTRNVTSGSTGSPRNATNGSTRNVAVRNYDSPRGKSNSNSSASPRSNGNSSTRSVTVRDYDTPRSTRNETTSPRNNGTTSTRSVAVRDYDSPRSNGNGNASSRGYGAPRSESAGNGGMQRGNSTTGGSQRSAAPREYSQQRGGGAERSATPRSESPRGNGNSGNARRG